MEDASAGAPLSEGTAAGAWVLLALCERRDAPKRRAHTTGERKRREHEHEQKAEFASFARASKRHREC